MLGWCCAGGCGPGQVLDARFQVSGGKRAVAGEYFVSMLPLAPTHLRDCAKQDQKPASWPIVPQTKNLSSERKARKNISKLKERNANVYENKGLLWKSWERSGNVYENKELSGFMS